jgi:glutaredoxin 2
VSTLHDVVNWGSLDVIKYLIDEKRKPKAKRQRKPETAAGVLDENTPMAGETEKKRLPAKKELRREAVQTTPPIFIFRVTKNNFHDVLTPVASPKNRTIGL